jgi:hypothetical protein
MHRSDRIVGVFFRGLRSAWIVVAAAGCATASLQPGETSYSMANGILTAVEAAGIRQVRSAAVKAMKELGLRPHERDSDAFSALVVGSVTVGVVPQQRDLRVRMERLTESTTELRLRILFTRDKVKLEQVLETIRKHLRNTT